MKKYKKVIVRVSILMSIFTFFFLTTTVKAEESNDSLLYVTYPTVEEVETQLLFFDFGSNTQEQAYYREFDNYNYLILNSYNVDENNEPNYEDLRYTRIYFIPDFLYPIRDITMQGDTFGNKLRYVPIHNRNCYILNYGLADCCYEEHLTQKIQGNIWYTTDTFYYFYIDYDYANSCWGALTMKSSSAQMGIYFNADNIKIHNINTEIYYYQIPSGQTYWSNVGTRFIYEEMGIVCEYEDVGFIGVEEDKESSYFDEDIVIDLDNGNQFEYEEITDSDDIMDTILKHIKNMWRAMLNTINNIRQLPTTIVQGFYDYIGKPIRAIYNIIFNFEDTFKAILEYLFVPSSNCINEFETIINEKYPFISDIPTVIDRVLNSFRYTSSQSPPEFNINIYGSTVNIFNISWLDNATRLFIRGIIGGLALYHFAMWLIRFIPKLLKGLD